MSYPLNKFHYMKLFNQRPHIDAVASSCHSYAMPRKRISTTVDEATLTEAHRLVPDSTNAEIIDEALKALVSKYREAEIDASFAIYETMPMNMPDAWGDLESWGDAVRKL
jgi:hypothetical protein